MADYREVIDGRMTVAVPRRSAPTRRSKGYLYVNVLVYNGTEARGEPLLDLEYDYALFRHNLPEAARLARREFEIPKES